MTTDETNLRSLLGSLESPAQPPSTVNLAEALAAGRHRLRRRRIARAGTSALAVCAVTAITIPAVGWLSHPASPPPRPVAGTAPRSFDPLRPYIFFTRLPVGAREFGAASGVTEVLSEVTERSGDPLLLVAFSARQCHLAGPMRYQYRSRPGGPLRTGLAPQSIRCPDGVATAGVTRTALIARAPRIGHANAYWINKFSHTQADALAWQYAAGGWAFVTPAVDNSPNSQTYYLSQSTKARLHLLAASARFGGKAPLRFPFQLTRVPAHWGINEVSTAHLQIGQSSKLVLGPARGRSPDLIVNWDRPPRPMNERQACGPGFTGGHPVHLAGGITGYLKILPAGADENQALCVPDGPRHAIVYISLILPRHPPAGPTATFRFNSAATVFNHLRFPQAGTTQPLG